MAGQQEENAGAGAGAGAGTVAGGAVVQDTAHQKPLHGDGAGDDDAANNAAAAALDPTTLPASLQHLSLSARSVHADDYLNSHQSVAPPMHVSTTFRYNRDPDLLAPWLNVNVRLFLPFTLPCFPLLFTLILSYMFIFPITTLFSI